MTAPSPDKKPECASSLRQVFLGGLLALAVVPLSAEVPAGYQPQDADERGLWMQMEEAERKLQTSNFVIRDPALNAYITQVFCRTVGTEQCADVRIYIVRTPLFNASMAPNGLMMVYSGLLLRMADEAQLAAILGHEYTHYKNQHSLKLFRDARTKSNAMAWMSVIPVANLAALGAMTVVQLGMVGSIYSFSRENETEADDGSLPLLAGAGYDPMAASRVWEQLRAEADATAAARKVKSRKDKTGGMFGTHPPTAERMTALAAKAKLQTVEGTPVLNRDQFRQAMAPFWTSFIDDQIKLNDFGATDFLIQNLATDGWTSELLYARGELYRSRGTPEDLSQAIIYYRQATALADAPHESWRGLGLALLRAGVTEEGRVALKQYLLLEPDAGDKAMMGMLAGG
jgi:Zn-dependent protease with chaperone function